MTDQKYYIRLNGATRHRYECKDPFVIGDREVVFTHGEPVIEIRERITIDYAELLRGDEVVARCHMPFAICMNPGSHFEIHYVFTAVDDEMRRRRNAHLN